MAATCWRQTARLADAIYEDDKVIATENGDLKQGAEGIREGLVQINRKDLAAGAVFIAIGLYFGLSAWFGLRIGRATAMGPGYFPVWLGAILVGFGLVIAIAAIGKPSVPMGIVSWRGVSLVTAGVVFFGVTVRGLGFAPALFFGVMMAALSTEKTSLRSAAIISFVLSAFSIAVFVWALRLPYDVIGPWLWHKG